MVGGGGVLLEVDVEAELFPPSLAGPDDGSGSVRGLIGARATEWRVMVAGGSAAGGGGVTCVEGDGELDTIQVEVVRSDVAVVQDERYLWVGGELREGAWFVGGCDGKCSDAEMPEMAQRASSGDAGQRVGVGGDGVTTVEDQETAGNWLRYREYVWRVRLRESRPGECKGWV